MTATSAELFDRGLDAFGAVVSQVPADGWQASSPCEGWTALDVLGHLKTSIDFGISILQGEQPTWPEAERPGDLIEGDPADAWRATAERARAALDGADLDLVMDTPMGPRTVADRQKRLEYVERALKINPANEQALKLKERLQAAPPAPPSEPSPEATHAPPTDAPLPETRASADKAVIRPIGPKTVDIPVTQSEKEQIARLMEKADIYLEAGDEEAAVAQWVEVLKLRVDHEVALRNAAGHLWRMRYWDDAEELVQRALDAGTQVPSIYLTAIDMAERRGDQGEAGMLREKIATLPAADEQLLVSVADYYLERHQTDQALRFLQQAIEALFSVKVRDVRTQIVRGKVKRAGRFVGKKSNWKKAIVTLTAGSKIEFFEGV